MKRIAIARAMALGLFRDTGALAMAFVTPPVVFVIFALIFSRTGGADLQVAVAIADEVGSADSQAVIEALGEASTIRPVGEVQISRAGVEAMLRRGEADAALVLSPAPQPGPPAFFTVLEAPSREIAAVVLDGTIRELLRQSTAVAPLPLDRVSVGPDSVIPVSIPYYAAAVALLFLLLSSVQGALSLQEERESGLFDRITGGPGGVRPVVEGKFLFLTVQGVIQAALIFAAAIVGFGVDLSGVWGLWFATTVLCAAAAAGMGILLVCLCRTKRQAHTIGNIIILILSALGGSMVPRFLMPPEMQVLGWATPNTWGLEAYAGFLWRGEGPEALIVPFSLLAGAALVSLIAASLITRRWS